MGLLFLGLAVLAGFGLAKVWGGPKGTLSAGPISAAPAAPPKASVGEVVASFPHAQWGQVLKVHCGDDGYRYVVGFRDGTAVELRGQEMTR